MIKEAVKKGLVFAFALLLSQVIIGGYRLPETDIAMTILIQSLKFLFIGFSVGFVVNLLFDYVKVKMKK